MLASDKARDLFWLKLFETVQEISGCDHLIGCTGMSILTSAGEFEGEPAEQKATNWTAAI